MLKWVVIGVVAILIVGGGVFAFASGGNGGGDEDPVLITAKVVRRDLREEVTVTGTLGRVEERTIVVSAASASGSGSAVGVQAGGGGAGGGGRSGGGGVGGGPMVNQIFVEDGGELPTDAPILALDGRASVTVNGDLPFFRKLDVGATGPDVVQLEIVLRDSGFSPGKVDTLFNERTRAALAQWQAAHLYPGDNPTTEQTVTVLLQPGNGYTIGEQSSAAATIGPYVPPYQPAAADFKTSDNAFLTDGPPGIDAVTASARMALRPDPVITIGATPGSVREGRSSTVTVTSTARTDEQPPSDLDARRHRDARRRLRLVLAHGHDPRGPDLDVVQPADSFGRRGREHGARRRLGLTRHRVHPWQPRCRDRRDHRRHRQARRLTRPRAPRSSRRVSRHRSRSG